MSIHAYYRFNSDIVNHEMTISPIGKGDTLEKC